MTSYLAATFGSRLKIPSFLSRFVDEHIRVAIHSNIPLQEAQLGLAADIGSLARIPKIAGNQSLVRELALTARDFSAAEGEKLGLVSRVVPGSRNQVIEEALKVARLIAANSPIAVVGTKRVLLHSRDSTVDENLEYVAAWNASMLQTVVS